MPNAFEELNRGRKVSALVDVIDATAVVAGIASNTENFAAMLARATPTVWANLSATAHVNPPSEITIARVLAIYRERPILYAAAARMMAPRVSP